MLKLPLVKGETEAISVRSTQGHCSHHLHVQRESNSSQHRKEFHSLSRPSPNQSRMAHSCIYNAAMILNAVSPFNPILYNLTARKAVQNIALNHARPFILALRKCHKPKDTIKMPTNYPRVNILWERETKMTKWPPDPSLCCEWLIKPKGNFRKKVERSFANAK